MLHQMSRRQWQLYEMDGANEAAAILNSELNRLIRETRLKMVEGMNGKEAALEVQKAMWSVMDRFHEFGATDTEPMCSLNDAVCKEFDVVISRWG